MKTGSMIEANIFLSMNLTFGTMFYLYNYGTMVMSPKGPWVGNTTRGILRTV